MNKLFVYFHGYGSSSKTDKVDILRLAFPDDTVVAFDANIDPEIAIREVSDKIDHTLLSDINGIREVVFIGTSLGGWLAGTLARLYGVHCVLINPAFDPKHTLKNINPSSEEYEIRSKYYPLNTDGLKAKYFFALNDDVIDNTEMIKKITDNVVIVTDADHKFNSHFHLVIEYLKGM